MRGERIDRSSDCVMNAQTANRVNSPMDLYPREVGQKFQPREHVLPIMTESCSGSDSAVKVGQGSHKHVARAHEGTNRSCRNAVVLRMCKGRCVRKEGGVSTQQ